MCFVKCLWVSAFGLTATSKLYAEVASLPASERAALSEADAALMIFLALGVIALQLRREQKRARRNRVEGLPTSGEPR